MTVNAIPVGTILRDAQIDKYVADVRQRYHRGLFKFLSFLKRLALEDIVNILNDDEHAMSYIAMPLLALARIAIVWILAIVALTSFWALGYYWYLLLAIPFTAESIIYAMRNMFEEEYDDAMKEWRFRKFLPGDKSWPNYVRKAIYRLPKKRRQCVTIGEFDDICLIIAESEKGRLGVVTPTNDFVN